LFEIRLQKKPNCLVLVSLYRRKDLALSNMFEYMSVFMIRSIFIEFAIIHLSILKECCFKTEVSGVWSVKCTSLLAAVVFLIFSALTRINLANKNQAITEYRKKILYLFYWSEEFFVLRLTTHQILRKSCFLYSQVTLVSKALVHE
jgi:hypothetical protein